MRSSLILIAAALLSPIAFSADIYVPDDYSKIQDAINVAVDGDTVIVRPGTYVENIDFVGKAITVQSELGADATTIDGNQSGSVVTFISGEQSDSILQGFTLTNGTGNYSSGIYYGLGAGIYCTDSDPTIKGNFIEANAATRSGGGIYCHRSRSLIADNMITGNSCGGYGGGGIFSDDSLLIISGNTISGNNARSNGEGGGICCSGSIVSIEINFIMDNSAAGDGGGIACLGSDPVVIGNTISGNKGRSGGGIFYYGSASVMTNNIISNNRARNYNGGGICCESSDPVIINCNVTENSSVSKGGGIYCDQSSSPIITNNIIAANSSDIKGGGIYLDKTSPTITNTIVWENAASIEPEIFVDSGNPAITFSDVKGGWPGIGNIDADPLFVDPDNGDFHLTFKSPCRNSGDNAAIPPALLKDIEGDPRIFETIVDMGADEFHTHLYCMDPVYSGYWISLKVIGTPSVPVFIGQGSGIQDPPFLTSYGYCFLEPPILLQTWVGSISADGVLDFTAFVPVSWQSGEKYPFQALVGSPSPGSVLTNLMVLTVE